MTRGVRYKKNVATPRINRSGNYGDSRANSLRDKPARSPVPLTSPSNGINRGPAPSHLALLDTILDEEALAIFRSTSTKPTTAARLSRQCGMPIATCHRWLRRLESLGLLVSEKKSVGVKGKPSCVYRSALGTILVRMEGARISTRLEMNTGSILLVSESETTLAPSEAPWVPQVHLRGRTTNPDPILVHRIEPRKQRRGTRRNAPIVLPMFLQEPARSATTGEEHANR